MGGETWQGQRTQNQQILITDPRHQGHWTFSPVHPLGDWSQGHHQPSEQGVNKTNLFIHQTSKSKEIHWETFPTSCDSILLYIPKQKRKELEQQWKLVTNKPHSFILYLLLSTLLPLSMTLCRYLDNCIYCFKYLDIWVLSQKLVLSENKTWVHQRPMRPRFDPFDRLNWVTRGRNIKNKEMEVTRGVSNKISTL